MNDQDNVIRYHRRSDRIAWLPIMVLIVPASLAVIALIVGIPKMLSHGTTSANRIVVGELCSKIEDSPTFRDAIVKLLLLSATCDTTSRELPKLDSAGLRSSIDVLAGEMPSMVCVAGWRRSTESAKAWDRLYVLGPANETTHSRLGIAISARDSTAAYFSSEAPIQCNGNIVEISRAEKKGSGIYRVYCQLQGADPDSQSSAPVTRCSLYFYFPLEDAFWYVFNLVYLSIIVYFLVLLAPYLKRRGNTQAYLTPILLALAIMVCVYSFRVLEALFGVTGHLGVSLSLKSVDLGLYYLLPDAALLAWGALLLLRHDKKIRIRWLVVVLVVFYLSNAPSLVNEASQLWWPLKSPFGWLEELREWPSVFYSFVAILLLGVGVFLGSRRLSDEGQSDASYFFRRNISGILLLLFLAWSLSQFSYIYRETLPVFAIVFVTKALALTGLVFFLAMSAYAREVEDRDEERIRSLKEIGRRSLDIILALDDMQRVAWFSAQASSLLGLSQEDTPLHTIVADPHDFRWLVNSLIVKRRTLRNFEMSFRGKDNEPLICQTDFIPRENVYQHDLIVARPVESVSMVDTHKRFHVHGLQGTVNMCKSWLQLLAQRVNTYGPLPASKESLDGLKEGLDELDKGISPGSEVTVDLSLREPKLCDLKTVLTAVDEEFRKGMRWDRLTRTVDIPDGPVYVRAKKTVLKMMIEELVDNANKKMIRLGPDRRADVSIQLTIPENRRSLGGGTYGEMLTIKVSDTGPGFEEDFVEKFKKPHYIMGPGDRGSLERVRFFAHLLGGKLSVENEGVASEGATVKRPAVTLELWLMKKEEENGKYRREGNATDADHRRQA